MYCYVNVFMKYVSTISERYSYVPCPAISCFVHIMHACVRMFRTCAGMTRTCTWMVSDTSWSAAYDGEIVQGSALCPCSACSSDTVSAMVRAKSGISCVRAVCISITLVVLH